ncbi:MAG: cobalt ECF transporter T component CbiQ [Gemmataceae bacterium]|nr:cobalt ECF transporter T component CbiQ [Gemmataceae bacterium]
MTLAFDLPTVRESPMRHWDARWKVASILLAVGLIAPLRTILPALVASALMIVVAAAARVRPIWLARRLGVVLMLLAFFTIWLPFFDNSDTRVEVLGISLSMPGLERFGVLMAKTAAIVGLILSLAASAPLEELFAASHRLHVPGPIVQVVLLAYRFVHLLAEEFGRLRTALRVRAFRNRADMHSWRTIGNVSGTLLVRSSDRAERVAQAMRCRGFDGQFRTLHAFRTRWFDVACFALLNGAAVGILLWDVANR